MAETPKIRVPKTAKKCEVVEIKTLIPHIMESGQRKGKDGKPIPRKIINKFVASFEGQDVFTANFEPAVSANPYIAFPFKASKSGAFTFTWVEDGGAEYTASKKMTVA